MTEQDFMALAPYLTITVGILITLLLVLFQRRPALIFTARPILVKEIEPRPDCGRLTLR